MMGIEDDDFLNDFIARSKAGEPVKISPVSPEDMLMDYINGHAGEGGVVESVGVPTWTKGKGSYDARYTYLTKNGDCVFCSNKATNMFYKPLLHEVKVKGAHGDMKAYHVCTKCLGRCTNKSSLNHEELMDYIQKMEARGSVRGRVGSGLTVRLIDGHILTTLDSVEEFVQLNREFFTKILGQSFE